MWCQKREVFERRDDVEKSDESKYLWSNGITSPLPTSNDASIYTPM